MESSVTRNVYGRERCDGTDDDGFLSNCMMFSTKNTIMKERIWINRVASEIVFLHVHPDTSALLHEERIIASTLPAKCH